MTAAALGATVQMKTLDDVVDIVIRPGTQAGSSQTIKGAGVTHLRGGGRGDAVVHIDVITPTRLDARQTELLRELAALRGEENPSGDPEPQHAGMFRRLKDAFGGK